MSSRHVQVQGTQRVVDPREAGGILQKINSQHGDKANSILVTIEERQRTLLLAVRDVMPGGELYWSYCSTGKDPNKVTCTCGGKAVTWRVGNKKFFEKACPGYC